MAGQDFGKGYRISVTDEIRKIRRSGKKIFSGRLEVYRYPSQTKGPRLAIALTRKAGNSVVRNRIRRKVREFFRKNKGVLGQYDYFFYGSRDLTSIKKPEWDKIIQSIGARCTSSSSSTQKSVS